MQTQCAAYPTVECVRVFSTCCFYWRELFAFLHIHFIGAGCRHWDTYCVQQHSLFAAVFVSHYICYFCRLILIAIVMRFCICVCICMQFLFRLSACPFVRLSVHLTA